MPQRPDLPDMPGEGDSLRVPSSRESAIYSYDMLLSLKRMAEAQNQRRLAALIEAAAAEAKLLSGRE